MRQLLWALLATFFPIVTCWMLRGGSIRSLGRLVPAIGQLAAALYRDERVPTKAKVSLAAFLAYLASPIDLIPDIIPVLGLLDDVVLVAVVLDGLLNQIDRQIVLEHWQGDEASLQAAAATASTLARFVPVGIRRNLFGSSKGSI